MAEIKKFWFFSGQKQAIFPLTIQRSNLDGGTPKSRWGDAQSQWGALNLDGGALNLDGGTRSPYNLSTGVQC